MAVVACVLPILPGKQEPWRRFFQVLQGSRSCEYEEFQRRLGITKVVVWLTQTPEVDIVVVYLEVEHPKQVMPQLAASNHPFDGWFRRQLVELQGLDVTQTLHGPPNELIFAWQIS